MCKGDLQNPAALACTFRLAFAAYICDAGAKSKCGSVAFSEAKDDTKVTKVAAEAPFNRVTTALTNTAATGEMSVCIKAFVHTTQNFDESVVVGCKRCLWMRNSCGQAQIVESGGVRSAQQ